MFSDQYMKLAAEKKFPKPLTNSQHRFVEFLLKNHKIVGQIGSYSELFDITRDFIKDNRDLFED